MSVDHDTFKAVMGQWPSGVTVVTTHDAEGPAGMTASSFSSVSLEPPLISVCVARHLAMHERLSKAGHFAVNILPKHGIEDGMRFAGMLPDVTDRFDGITTHKAETGSPILDGMLGWVDCRCWAQYDGGDHTIFIGEVLDAGIDRTASPLLYHSRSWGQFADVLANEVTLGDAAARSPDTLVIDNAFTHDDDGKALCQQVESALGANPDTRLLILDDADAQADPLRLRVALQAIAGLLGRSSVGLNLGAGPLALANAVVALKSGVRHLGASPHDDGPYVSGDELRDLLTRMKIHIKS